MGALCGKETKDDNFTGPGRRVDSAPPERSTAPLPANKRIVGGPPRTLGARNPATGAAGGPSSAAADAADARLRAAEAAEARAKAAESKATGKLGTQLQAQKKQTMNETLMQDAHERARQREVDNAAAQRKYD